MRPQSSRRVSAKRKCLEYEALVTLFLFSSKISDDNLNFFSKLLPMFLYFFDRVIILQEQGFKWNHTAVAELSERNKNHSKDSHGTPPPPQPQVDQDILGRLSSGRWGHEANYPLLPWSQFERGRHHFFPSVWSLFPDPLGPSGHSERTIGCIKRYIRANFGVAGPRWLSCGCYCHSFRYSVRCCASSSSLSVGRPES